MKGEFEGRFPDPIGIQGFENGFNVALNEPFDQLIMKWDPNLEVRFDFEGDLFETEYQRNWTDASFKTYWTRLSLGYPHRAALGDSKLQSIARARKSLINCFFAWRDGQQHSDAL